jgi:hypothetical protein
MRHHVTFKSILTWLARSLGALGALSLIMTLVGMMFFLWQLSAFLLDVTTSEVVTPVSHDKEIEVPAMGQMSHALQNHPGPVAPLPQEAQTIAPRSRPGSAATRAVHTAAAQATETVPPAALLPALEDLSAVAAVEEDGTIEFHTPEEAVQRLAEAQGVEFDEETHDVLLEEYRQALQAPDEEQPTAQATETAPPAVSLPALDDLSTIEAADEAAEDSAIEFHTPEEAVQRLAEAQGVEFDEETHDVLLEEYRQALQLQK